MLTKTVISVHYYCKARRNEVAEKLNKVLDDLDKWAGEGEPPILRIEILADSSDGKGTDSGDGESEG